MFNSKLFNQRIWIILNIVPPGAQPVHFGVMPVEGRTWFPSSIWIGHELIGWSLEIQTLNANKQLLLVNVHNVLKLLFGGMIQRLNWTMLVLKLVEHGLNWGYYKTRTFKLGEQRKSSYPLIIAAALIKNYFTLQLTVYITWAFPETNKSVNRFNPTLYSLQLWKFLSTFWCM